MFVRDLKLTPMFLALLLVACGTEPDTSTPDQPTKAEVAQQIAEGKADHGVDWCEVLDWYGDGICDEFCTNPDPDCAQTYEPCGGLTCGDLCSLCAPDDVGCVETAVIKMCQPDGSCDATVPTCAGDDDGDDGDEDGGDEDGGDDTYDPCGGLACGDSCSLCAPGDFDCVETAELKFCQADGTCMGIEPATCDPSGGWDPCAGKSCGDGCSLCDPSDPTCFETAVLKVCNDFGVCSDTSAVCQ